MIRRYWSDFVFGVLALFITAWVAWDAFRFRIVTFSPGADYWEHTAVLRALLDNPWHPSHPLLAIDVPSPRFNPHFLLVALLGRLLHFDAIDAMALAAVINVVLLLAGIWCFFRVYFRDPRASLYGLVVFFGSWFDAPHFSNVFKLKVYFSVAGYPSSAAMAVTLLGLALAVALLREQLRRPVWLAVSALLWAYVYVTHPLTATMGLPAAVFLAATEPGVARALRLRVGGSVIIGFCLSALWPYYPALGMVLGGTVHRVQGLDPDAQAPRHEFYEWASQREIVGYCFASFLLMPYLWVRRQDVFALLGVFLMLAVFFVSSFVPVPLGHRYLLLSVFFLQVILVRWLLLLTPRGSEVSGSWARRWLRLPVVAAVQLWLVYVCVQNVRVARQHFQHTAEGARGKESATLRYARRVGELAGRRGIVLSTAFASWPVPTFGPKIITPLHKNPLIVDAEARRRDATRFFAARTSTAERNVILDRYGVTHVLVPPRGGSAAWGFLEGKGPVRQLAGGFSLVTLERRSPAH